MMDQFLGYLAHAVNKPEAKLTRGQRLKDLPNWDSLAILTTISMIDQEYGVLLGGSEIQSCCTVEDLYSKVMDSKTG